MVFVFTMISYFCSPSTFFIQIQHKSLILLLNQHLICIFIFLSNFPIIIRAQTISLINSHSNFSRSTWNSLSLHFVNRIWIHWNLEHTHVLSASIRTWMKKFNIQINRMQLLHGTRLCDAASSNAFLFCCALFLF